MLNDPVSMLMVLFIVVGGVSIVVNLRKIFKRKKSGMACRPG